MDQVDQHLLDDLVDTIDSYQQSILEMDSKIKSTDSFKIPPGHRLRIMHQLDQDKRRYSEVSKCAASALRFVRKTVDIMKSYEQSIARLEKELIDASPTVDRKKYALVPDSLREALKLPQ